MMETQLCFDATVIVAKLSVETASSSGIVTINSPGGSILQWDAVRGLLCLAAFVRV